MNPAQRYDVAVVGGGIIGLCVAEALALRGAKVAVLEGDRCGGAATAGNAGWVTPGLSSPVPAPGVVAKGIRWMLSARGPLRVNLRTDLAYGRWIYRFWRSSKSRPHREGVVAMAGLAARALPDFDDLAARLPKFEMHRNGILFVSRNPATLANEVGELELLHESGYDSGFKSLGPAAALAEEPELCNDLAGAILAPSECHVRPETLAAALMAKLSVDGVEVRERAPVSGLVREGGAWTIRWRDGETTAARVVLCAGVASARLLRPLGVRVPLEAAKGYSITQQMPSVVVRRPVYLLDEKVAVSPFDGSLRFAGVLELGARDLEISRQRVESIKLAAARTFERWDDVGESSSWAGMRSMLPDGLPAIGKVPGCPELYLATGHAMLGVTLAPTTAALLAPLVLDGVLAPELYPLELSRFRRRPGQPTKVSG